MSEKPRLFPEFKGCISGIVGAWCGIFVGTPFDIIKVRLQNNGGSAASTLKHLLKNEGILTLWKGALPVLIGSGFTSSMTFGVNENSKRLISRNNKPGECLTISQHALCGTAAGFTRGLVSCAPDHIRIKMQVQGKVDPRGDPIYKNSIDCFKTIWKNHGIVGMYKGLPAMMTRELFGSTFYFAAYHYSGRKLFGEINKNTDELRAWKIMICGAIAGVTFWTLVLPIDVVKSRMQADSLSNPKYKSMLDCVKSTYLDHGYKGFTRGFLPLIMRAVPVNAFIFIGFETTMSFFGRDYR